MARSTICVFNLPGQISEEEVRTTFERCGPVQVKLWKTSNDASAAMVAYPSADMAKVAKQTFEGYTLMGRQIK